MSMVLRSVDNDDDDELLIAQMLIYMKDAIQLEKKALPRVHL